MLWDVYINVDVTNLISANDVSHRTYWKAKIIGAKIYKLCGRWWRKEKGQLPVTVVETLHGGRWRSSNPVGQKQSHDRDQDYEFADIASSSIWVCFKQNCDDFRSECPWRSFVVLIAEQSLWMTDSHVFKLVKFVSCKNNPTNKQGVSASYARFWGDSVNKEIIDYPALVEQIVSLCSFPKP